jgi:hypothetical protein
MGSSFLKFIEGGVRRKKDAKYVEVVLLNLGGGNEMIALGRRDILRGRAEDPFLLVARLRVIIAGVSPALLDDTLSPACDEQGRLCCDLLRPSAEASND